MDRIVPQYVPVTERSFFEELFQVRIVPINVNDRYIFWGSFNHSCFSNNDSIFQFAGWFKSDISSNPWWFLARMKRRVRMIKNTLKKHGRQTGRNFTDIWWHLYYEYFVICDLIRKHHVSLQLYSWIPSHIWLWATLFLENHGNWCKTTWKNPKTIHQFFYVLSVFLHFKVKKTCFGFF